MKFMQKSILGLFIGVGLALTLLSVSRVYTSEIQPEAYRAENPDTPCEPTPADYLGPFYKANAPVRSSVGKGYKLTGMVVSSADCTPSIATLHYFINTCGFPTWIDKKTMFSNGYRNFEIFDYPSAYVIADITAP
jgi:hypothetical protein